MSPKTGGEAISDALLTKPSKNKHEFVWENSIRDKHETITECMMLKKNINNYFKFTFVRNPWDILVTSLESNL